MRVRFDLKTPSDDSWLSRARGQPDLPAIGRFSDTIGWTESRAQSILEILARTAHRERTGRRIDENHFRSPLQQIIYDLVEGEIARDLAEHVAIRRGLE